MSSTHTCRNEHAEDIETKLVRLLKDHAVPGLILTGFDSDQCHPGGVELVLSKFKPDWVMYPKYFKDTDCATEVFGIIGKHQRRRQSTSHPLEKISVRLDQIDERTLSGLSMHFSYELFSPHMMTWTTRTTRASYSN